MRIKSLVSAATVNHSFVPGIEYDVPDDLGAAMVSAGQAETVTAAQKEPAAPVITQPATQPEKPVTKPESKAVKHADK